MVKPARLCNRTDSTIEPSRMHARASSTYRDPAFKTSNFFKNSIPCSPELALFLHFSALSPFSSKISSFLFVQPSSTKFFETWLRNLVQSRQKNDWQLDQIKLICRKGHIEVLLNPPHPYQPLLQLKFLWHLELLQLTGKLISDL